MLQRGYISIKLRRPKIDLAGPLSIVDQLPIEFENRIKSLPRDLQESLRSTGMDVALERMSRTGDRDFHITVACNLSSTMNEYVIRAAIVEALRGERLPRCSIPFHKADAFDTPSFGGGSALVLCCDDDDGNPFVGFIKRLNEALTTGTPSRPFKIHTSLAYLNLPPDTDEMKKAVATINYIVEQLGSNADVSSLVYTSEPGAAPLIFKLSYDFDANELHCEQTELPRWSNRIITPVVVVLWLLLIVLYFFYPRS